MIRGICWFGMLLATAPTVSALKPGDAPPAVQAKNQEGKSVDLGGVYGHRPVVLFFYPKSFTSGCTVEVQAFRDADKDLRVFDAAVFGVSCDEQETQHKFCDSYRLKYDLLADKDGVVAKAFDIPVNNGLSARWTVVIGRTGRVLLIDSNVSKDIKGHPAKVVSALKQDWEKYVAGFKPLFDRKDLEGWEAIAAESDTWKVVNGELHCTGKPTCYVRTKASHKNYKLLLEFMYPEKLGNAGVLVHINGEDKVWPQSIEPNLNVDQMGKIYLIGGASLEYVKDNPSAKVDIPAGLWHRYEITCKGDTIRLALNGVVVNEGRKASPSSGTIGLQSEGVPIRFRTIAIKSLAQ
ncbi:MAG TPA: DUF1080 domain-containing protein [Phycisphaerae bacterium]|nr:DUF1080 domain-containing protein [Phycisphaerae bacterium]HRY71136.1 DUF1080 domain-containing protein [Phycisphaerae bacterium]HSA30032.1 DUF1080 domain-containing protein [Phycisphaerae bacterium]